MSIIMCKAPVVVLPMGEGKLGTYRERKHCTIQNHETRNSFKEDDYCIII